MQVTHSLGNRNVGVGPNNKIFKCKLLKSYKTGRTDILTLVDTKLNVKELMISLTRRITSKSEGENTFTDKFRQKTQQMKKIFNLICSITI